MSPRDRVTTLPSRRQVLRLGTGLFALPWLASAARADAPTARSLFVMALPNGYPIDSPLYAPGFPDRMTPPVGPIGAPTRVLTPLHDAGLDYRYVSRLEWMSPRDEGDGASEAFADDGHAGEFHCLTGDSLNKRTIPTDDRQWGFSVDQRVRDHLDATLGPTAWPSVHLGCPEGPYDDPIAHRGPDNPLPSDQDPAVLFGRLFGGDADQRRRRSSVLDVLTRRDNAWLARLSTADRAKLDQHLTAVRELELRLSADRPSCDPGGPPGPVPDGSAEERFVHRVEAWVALVPVLLACGLTRVVTLAFGPGGTLRTFGFLGWHGGYHDYSHAGFADWDPEKVVAMEDITRWHLERFAEVATGLAERSDAEGRPLLDDATMLLANGLGSCSHHTHDDHVAIVAGGGGGTLVPGRWHVDAAGRPYGDLLTSIAQGFGRPGLVGHWATGPLDGLAP